MIFFFVSLLRWETLGHLVLGCCGWMSPWYIPRLHPGNFDMSITNDGLDSGKNTLPRTNVAPENRPSQKEIAIPTILFQGLVSGRVSLMIMIWSSAISKHQESDCWSSIAFCQLQKQKSSMVPFQFGLNNNVRSQKWEVFDGHHDYFETIFLQLDIILEIRATPIYPIFWDPLQTRRPNIIIFQRPIPFNPTWNG